MLNFNLVREPAAEGVERPSPASLPRPEEVAPAPTAGCDEEKRGE